MSTDPATPDRFRLQAEVCKVLTDPKRLMLLHALRDGDRTVGDLAAAIGTSLPNASQHLAVLRASGLVDGRREGPVVRYRLAEPAIIDACAIVGGIVERRSAGRSPIRPTASPLVQQPASPATIPAGPSETPWP